MFLRATSLFNELKALDASTRITASVADELNISRNAWMAASHPASCPAHNWSGPVTDRISSLRIFKMVRLMIRRTVSLMPIGRTPGHLSNAMRQQATSGSNALGAT